MKNKTEPPHWLLLFLLIFPLFFVQLNTVQAEEALTPADYGRTWQDLPVIPELSEFAKGILHDGIRNGNNPAAFSKIGDCDTSTTWYLSDYDMDERYYELGDYADQFNPVIDFFQGSFGRFSLAAKPGFSAASVLSNYWTDTTLCEADDIPLTCEYRIHNPAFALISFGTNDGYNPPSFKENLREVIELTLAQSRLPVLMTKADNVEGNFSINQDIADLAAEYQLPLWNFWPVIQELPGHGLVEDGIHLTFYRNDFSDPRAFEYAWTYRNLTALQVLDGMMQAILAIQ